MRGDLQHPFELAIAVGLRRVSLDIFQLQRDAFDLQVFGNEVGGLFLVDGGIRL